MLPTKPVDHGDDIDDTWVFCIDYELWDLTNRKHSPKINLTKTPGIRKDGVYQSWKRKCPSARF